MDRSELRRIIEAKFDRYARQVIKHLEEYPQEAMLSGEDSPMENTWEEWVVQVRGEQSVHYDVYEFTVRGICEAVADSLPKEERDLLSEAFEASDEGQPALEDEAAGVLSEELFDRVSRIAKNMKLPKRLQEYLHPSAD